MADINFTKLRILIVDDEPFMRQLLTRVLGELEIQKVTEAADGLEALTIFSNDSNNFDLVICDLEMPNMDGFEFVSGRQRLPVPNNRVREKITLTIILTGCRKSRHGSNKKTSTRTLPVCCLIR